MKNLYVIFGLLLYALSTHAKDAYTENKGQIADQYHQLNNDVLYLYNGKDINVQLRKDGFSYDL